MPKELYSHESLEETFKRISGETDGKWLLPCRHVFHPPASPEQLDQAERKLGFHLPPELKEFLLLSDGAELFSLHYQYTSEWADWIARYQILGTTELPSRYDRLLQTLRASTEDDPDYQHITDLNYLPFCHVGDANYLAIVRSGPEAGHVIYIDNEFALGYLPYDDYTRGAYATAADSLEAWLGRLIETEGWDAYGREPPYL